MPETSHIARWHELQWCLHGPDLLAHSGLPLFRWPASQRAAHETLPPTPEPLHHRLGRRFEQHWQHAFTQLPGWTVLGAGIQIQSAGRTLGELDLLVTSEGEVWHLELAVKFYLCAPGHSGDILSDWIGPNGRDRLDRKLARMRDHQLPLGQSDPARDTLQALGLPAPTRSAAVLNGIRFSHWQAPHSDVAGRWCSVRDLPAAVPEGRVLSRPEWLGHAPTAQDDWQSGPALLHAVAIAGRRGPAQLVDPSGVRWLAMPGQ
ncbi:MAG: hypothetical protein CL927_14845 [Deltaproteobacteria bacterium]|nr:hypothetical protein [Deltaproteobacteria bacterium]HCH62568.1 hypothetical protein [Deltaproteobacteria bacterium]